ncbi:MAG: chemotaxis protein CheB, partial [Chloroflexota bacterium]
MANARTGEPAAGSSAAGEPPDAAPDSLPAPAPEASSAPVPTRAAPSTVVRRRRPKPPVPVVAIGASAGGLEALEAFFARVSAPCGLAFVVIQHLDPTHVGMLPEILGRATSLHTVEATAGMPVKADTVYVIPPNSDMAILNGRLQVLEPFAPRGLRLPIDFFFRSLAEDRGATAIGIILSGMGSDGTIGMRAIREKGGSTFAQSPADAKFDAMPRSAIAAGLVDVVDAASALPKRVLDFLSATRTRTGGEADDIAAGGAVDRSLVLMRQRT